MLDHDPLSIYQHPLAKLKKITSCQTRSVKFLEDKIGIEPNILRMCNWYVDV